MSDGRGGTGGRGVNPGSGGAGGTAPAPPLDPAACASKMTWTGGNDGSNDMQPGAACIACHTKQGGGQAPTFAVAGTVYAMVNEPNECYGVSGSTGVRVVITGADGAVVTLTPTASGNFAYQGTIATPLRAKVTDMNGGERAMGGSQTTGDCNACHTETGVEEAPGRIVVP